MSKTERILQYLKDHGPLTDAEMSKAFPPGSGHMARAFNAGYIRRNAEDRYEITESGVECLSPTNT